MPPCALRPPRISLLAETPPDPPDILPSTSQIYAKKVARLAEALNRPEDWTEAAESLRKLIERIVLRPDANRGEMHATLHGDLGTILDWVARGP